MVYLKSEIHPNELIKKIHLIERKLHKNKRIINGGLYKSGRCKPCYNKDISVRNKKRQKALKEARWF